MFTNFISQHFSKGFIARPVLSQSFTPKDDETTLFVFEIQTQDALRSDFHCSLPRKM